MCGIFGINESNEKLAELASRTIAYRGPDQQAVWADRHVSLGFNRLAIIDLDQRANQPMWDEDRELAIIFNGEIYNFKELKRDLEADYKFRTKSDTEVLLYGYKKYGASFVERLNGMFAFCIYDIKKGKILLFRDHAGIKPLYYYEKHGLFLFASEIKAIIRALGAKGLEPEINHEALKTYFAFAYIPSPKTLYKNIRKLPRSSFLEFDLKKKEIIHIETFSPPSEPPANHEQLFSLVERAIMEHLVSDVPVGVFFSGGTDSSTIASVLHRRGVDLETFSIRVLGREADRKYFSEIAKHLALRSHVYDFAAREFNEVYEEVMSKMDEPNPDISIFPTYYVAKRAAKHVKVVLSGEGGDELFFGYKRQRAMSYLRASEDAAGLSLLDRLFVYTPSFKGKNYLFEKSFILAGKPASAYLLSMSPSRDLISPDAWKAAKRELTERAKDPLYFDRDLYLENALLRKTDYATSLNSIEGRVPLLDSRIVGAAPRFEDEYISANLQKPVLKEMLARALPHDLVYREKSGFGMSLPAMLPHSKELDRDLDESIPFLSERNLLYARIPKKAELVRRYPALAFALICLYRTIKNNELLLKQRD